MSTPNPLADAPVSEDVLLLQQQMNNKTIQVENPEEFIDKVAEKSAEQKRVEEVNKTEVKEEKKEKPKTLQDFNKSIGLGKKAKEEKVEPIVEKIEPKVEKVEPKVEEKAEEKPAEKVRERKFEGFEKKTEEKVEEKVFDINSMPAELKSVYDKGKEIENDSDYKLLKALKKDGGNVLEALSKLNDSNPKGLSDKQVFEKLLKEELGQSGEQVAEALENFDTLSISDKVAIKNYKEKLSNEFDNKIKGLTEGIDIYDKEGAKQRQELAKQQEQATKQFVKDVDASLAQIKGQDFLGINMDDKEMSDFKEFLKSADALPVPVKKDGTPDVQGFIENNFKVKNFDSIVSTAIEYGIAQGLMRKKDEQSNSGASRVEPAAPASATKSASPGDKNYHLKNLPMLQHVTKAVKAD